jgi:hypothetical protein
MSEIFFYIGLVLGQTPVWAWIVLLGLVVLGVRRLRSRPTSLLMMSATPVVFLIWSLVSTVTFVRGDGGWFAALLWPACVLLGLCSFRLVGADSVVWVDQSRLVRPGTVGPLLVYLGVFLFRYSLEVWSGFAPERLFLTRVLAVLVSGYMAGRSLGDLWFAARLRPRQSAVIDQEPPGR